MKYLSLLMLCLTFTTVSYTAEVGVDEPEEKTPAEQVLDIKDLMIVLEDNLRNDRHDSVVQLYAKEIEDKLEKLIKDADSDKKDSKKKEKKENPEKTVDNNEPNKNPPKDSKLHQVTVAPHVIQRERMPWETREYDNWASLPDVKRANMLQTYNEFENLPGRWKVRIRAYFYSIASLDPENVKNEEIMVINQNWSKQDRILEDLKDLKVKEILKEKVAASEEYERGQRVKEVEDETYTKQMELREIRNDKIQEIRSRKP